MDPKCSTDKSVIVFDPFHHSRRTAVFCLFFLRFILFSLSIYLSIYVMFVFLEFRFVSLSVYRGCWRMYVVPVIAQRTTSNDMALYFFLLLSTPLLPVS